MLKFLWRDFLPHDVTYFYKHLNSPSSLLSKYMASCSDRISATTPGSASSFPEHGTGYADATLSAACCPVHPTACSQMGVDEMQFSWASFLLWNLPWLPAVQSHWDCMPLEKKSYVFSLYWSTLLSLNFPHSKGSAKMPPLPWVACELPTRSGPSFCIL